MLKPTCAGPYPYRTPCSHSAVLTEVSSQRIITGGSGEDGVTKGPGKVTPGDRIFGLSGVPPTALEPSTDEHRMLAPFPETRIAGNGPHGCCV